MNVNLNELMVVGVVFPSWVSHWIDVYAIQVDDPGEANLAVDGVDEFDGWRFDDARMGGGLLAVESNACPDRLLFTAGEVVVFLPSRCIMHAETVDRFCEMVRRGEYQNLRNMGMVSAC